MNAVRQFKMSMSAAAMFAVMVMAAGVQAQTPEQNILIWDADNDGYHKYGEWYGYSNTQYGGISPWPGDDFHNRFVNSGGKVTFGEKDFGDRSGLGFNWKTDETGMDISGWAGLLVTYSIQSYANPYHGPTSSLQLYIQLSNGINNDDDYIMGMNYYNNNGRVFFPFFDIDYNVRWERERGGNPTVSFEDVLRNCKGLQFGTSYFNDGAGGVLTIKKIEAVVPFERPAITDINPPNSGEVGAYYSGSIFADGLVTTWDREAGLPPGLTFSAGSRTCNDLGECNSSASISGRPGQAGEYTFTVKAENRAGSDTKQYTVNIIAQRPPVFTATTLPDGAVDRGYGRYTIATGFGITYSLQNGTLPPGLSLGYDNYSGEVYIQGTPTTHGTYNFTVMVRNAANSETKQFTITIPKPLAPVIITTELKGGEVGRSYSDFIRAAGLGVTWTLVSGPSWLNLYNWGSQCEQGEITDYCYNSGNMRGTPNQEAGQYYITVKAENAGGIATKTFTITIMPQQPQQPPVITDQIIIFDVSFNYYISDQAISVDGSGVICEIITGDLPSGFSLIGNGCRVTPEGYGFDCHGPDSECYGEYPVVVEARNSAGSSRAKITVVTVTREMNPPPPPSFTTTTLRDGITGDLYDEKIYVLGRDDGGNFGFPLDVDIVLSIDGELPPGLIATSTWRPSDWMKDLSIRGTPEEAGTYHFTVKAEQIRLNGDRGPMPVVTQPFTITVTAPPPPVITTTELGDGRVNSYYVKPLSADGSGLMWSHIPGSGNLPPGLNVHSNSYGTYVEGIPRTPGTFKFKVEARNSAGADTKEYTVVIVGADEPMLPVIDVNLEDIAVNVGDVPQLVVLGSSPDGGVITYQWYKSGAAGNFNGTEIAGETDNTYAPSTAAAGTFYYYVVVKNTNTAINGDKTATSLSRMSTVIVEGVVAEKYMVTVTGGTGGGEYEEGETVTVTANTATSGQQFKNWTVVSGGVTLSSTTAASATFTMPSNAVSVSAVFEPIPTAEKYAVTVTGGTGGGEYEEGETVTIAAGSAPSGQQFKNWTVVSGGVTLSSAATATATFTMPSSAVEVSAVFEPIPTAEKYAVTVTSGTGGGEYEEGETVTIVADDAPDGQRFKNWTVVSGGVTLSSATAKTATFTMPSSAVEVSAVFEPIPTAEKYAVTVTNGAGGGEYEEGETVTVTAAEPDAGQRFKEWTVVSGGVTLSSATAATATFTMPSSAVEVNAVFEDIPITPPITYTITFDANGGKATTESAETGEDGNLASLPALTRDGYKFEGWFTSKTGGGKVTAATVFEDDATVYAQWTLKPVPVITIDNDNGSGSGGESPTVGGTLTVNFSLDGAEYSYSWKLGGAAIGKAGEPYTVTAADIGGRITLEIVDSESGETYTVKTAPITKGVKPDKPDNAPTVERVTYSSIKLAETAGYDYAIETGGVKRWQESALFNGLKPNKEYTFYQRMAETKTAYASLESSGKNQKTADKPVQSGLDKIMAKLRNRPEVPRVEEASVTAPSIRLVGEFTAGPNPVSKQNGIVNFYRSGKQLANSELRIYDANGNVINKVRISDMAIDNNVKRTAGSWDLRDSNGKPVSSGTYLVKGVLKTVDGKSEKVSLILGVR